MINAKTICPSDVPLHLWSGIRAYILEARPVGDFLRAVISNNLKETIAYADEESMRNLQAIVRFFYNEAPTECWGSPQKYKGWIVIQGL